jgi:hypothetical protein
MNTTPMRVATVFAINSPVQATKTYSRRRLQFSFVLQTCEPQMLIRPLLLFRIDALCRHKTISNEFGSQAANARPGFVTFQSPLFPLACSFKYFISNSQVDSE